MRRCLRCSPAPSTKLRFDRRSLRVFKRTHIAVFGEPYGIPYDYGHAGLASEYLLQLHLSAYALGDSIRLHGIVENTRGDFLIVTSQQFVTPATDNVGSAIELTYEMVQEALAFQGFEEFSGGHFVHRQNNIRLNDAVEYNFVLSANGLAPIDVHVTPFQENQPVIPVFGQFSDASRD